MPITKSQRVLDYVRTENGFAHFEQPGMEEGVSSTLSIPERDYLDAGSPKQVTITIRFFNELEIHPDQAAAAGTILRNGWGQPSDVGPSSPPYPGQNGD